MAETEFKYDVFVSYSSANKDWVRKTFVPILEIAGLKVCDYYRDFDVAVQHLGGALLHHLHPTLRPEHPQANAIVGYEAARTQAEETLAAGKSVALIGPGGIGKTALGAELRFKPIWIEELVTLARELLRVPAKS